MTKWKSQPYDVNDRIILTGEFLDETNDLIDPEDITLEIVCPDGTVISKGMVDLTRVSEGVYEYRYDIANGIGYYYVTWTATGTTLSLSKEKRFPVRLALAQL